jgi:hypothetical protein
MAQLPFIDIAGSDVQFAVNGRFIASGVHRIQAEYMKVVMVIEWHVVRMSELAGNDLNRRPTPARGAGTRARGGSQVS